MRAVQLVGLDTATLLMMQGAGEIGDAGG